MATYDLTPKIAKFLDRHLAIPLLEHLLDKKLYSYGDLRKASVEVVAGTKMLDYAYEVHNQIVEHMRNEGELSADEEAPVFEIDDLDGKRDKIFREMEDSSIPVKPLLEHLENPEVVGLLRENEQENNFQKLKEAINFTEEQLENLYNFARIRFDCGDYDVAGAALHNCANLFTDADMCLSALWGKFAANICGGHEDAQLEDHKLLRDAIETLKGASNEVFLRQRTWFLHWSLFLLARHPRGKEVFIELLNSAPYMNTVQTSCPWLLRYVAVAHVNSLASSGPRHRNVLRDLAKIIHQESYTYSDPITEFLECILITVDFETAGIRLAQCEEILDNDFFTQHCAREFIQNARFLFFESYTRVYSVTDMTQIFGLLGLTAEEGERWIINIARGGQIDVKIDFESKIVRTSRNPVSSSQYVVEKTRNAINAGQNLVSAIEGREREFARREREVVDAL